MASFAQFQQPLVINPHEFVYAAAYTCDSEQSYLQPAICGESNLSVEYFQHAHKQQMLLNDPYSLDSEQLQQLNRQDTAQRHLQTNFDFFSEHQTPVSSSTSGSGTSTQSASGGSSPSTQFCQVSERNQRSNICSETLQQGSGIPTPVSESCTIPGNVEAESVGELPHFLPFIICLFLHQTRMFRPESSE